MKSFKLSKDKACGTVPFSDNYQVLPSTNSERYKIQIIQVVSRADLAFNQCGVVAWQTFSCQNYLWLLGRGLPAQEHSAVTSYDTHLNPQCTLPWGVAFSFVYCKISCTHNLYVDLLYFSGLPQCHSNIWGRLKCDLQDCVLFVSVLPHF